MYKWGSSSFNYERLVLRPTFTYEISPNYEKQLHLIDLLIFEVYFVENIKNMTSLQEFSLDPSSFRDKVQCDYSYIVYFPK